MKELNEAMRLRRESVRLYRQSVELEIQARGLEAAARVRREARDGGAGPMLALAPLSGGA